MNVVQLASPTSSTPFLRSGGLKKHYNFSLDTFTTKQLKVIAKEFGTTTNFEKMQVSEKSRGNDNFVHNYFMSRL